MTKPPAGKCQLMNRALSSAYSAGCRCDQCIAWQRAYAKWRKEQAAEARLPSARRLREPREPEDAPYGTRARACQHARLVAKRMLALQQADAMVLMIALDHFEDMLRREVRKAPTADGANATEAQEDTR